MSIYTPIRNYCEPLQAGMAKELLLANDIPCYLDTENHSFANWMYIGGIGGITLLVQNDRFEEAKDLLEIFESQYSEEISEKCPQCNSGNITEQNTNWGLKLLWCLFSGTPSRYNKFNRICKDCGHTWNIDITDDDQCAEGE